MKVYRVEGPNGLGPYQNCLAHSRHYEMPSPVLDGVFSWKDLASDYTDYVFGFKSLSQLNAWFDKHDLRRFAESKNLLFEFEVNPKLVRFGHSQVAFPRSKAYSCKRVRRSKVYKIKPMTGFRGKRTCPTYTSKKVASSVTSSWPAPTVESDGYSTTLKQLLSRMEEICKFQFPLNSQKKLEMPLERMA